MRFHKFTVRIKIEIEERDRDNPDL